MKEIIKSIFDEVRKEVYDETEDSFSVVIYDHVLTDIEEGVCDEFWWPVHIEIKNSFNG